LGASLKPDFAASPQPVEGAEPNPSSSAITRRFANSSAGKVSTRRTSGVRKEKMLRRTLETEDVS
jgi:hypothetical protein